MKKHSSSELRAIDRWVDRYSKACQLAERAGHKLPPIDDFVDPAPPGIRPALKIKLQEVRDCLEARRSSLEAGDWPMPERTSGLRASRRAVVLCVVGLAILVGAAVYVLHQSDPWPSDEEKHFELAGGWQLSLARTNGPSVAYGRRIIGKLKYARLRHPDFGEFYSEQPHVDLQVSGEKARGEIEGEFVSRNLDGSLTLKVPSGSAWMKGKIHFGNTSVSLEPSDYRLCMKKAELERYIRESAGPTQAGDRELSAGVWACDLHFTPLEPSEIDFAGNRICFQTNMKVAGTLKVPALGLKMPFCAHTGAAGDCVVSFLQAGRLADQILQYDVQLKQVALQALELTNHRQFDSLARLVCKTFLEQPEKLRFRARTRPFMKSNEALRSLLEKVVLTKLAIAPEGEWVTVHGECALITQARAANDNDRQLRRVPLPGERMILGHSQMGKLANLASFGN